jgi:hypothetical protein
MSPYMVEIDRSRFFVSNSPRSATLTATQFDLFNLCCQFVLIHTSKEKHFLC